MIPIPVCNSTDLGWLKSDCPHGFEFHPKGNWFAWLRGGSLGSGAVYFQWTVMDEVEGPDDLELGKYGLLFRWDNEATPQVSNAGSNILIL